MKEVEVKLAFNPADRDRVAAELSQWLGPSIATRELINAYYDTPEMDLRQRKWSLRVREAGDYIEQTAKGKGSVVGGLHSRIEKNWPLAKAVLEPDKLSEIPELVELDTERLQRAFQTRFKRTEWICELDDHRIELVMDTGVIEAPHSKCPIAEIELELKQGPESALIHLAADLVERIPCWLLSESKAHRGYNLFSTAQPFSLLSDMSAIQSVTHWVDYYGSWISRFLADPQAKEASLADGNGGEYLHLLAVLSNLLNDRNDSIDIQQLLTVAIADYKQFIDREGNAKLAKYFGQATFPGQLGVACIKLPLIQ